MPMGRSRAPGWSGSRHPRMGPCPPGTRARGSWGVRTHSPARVRAPVGALRRRRHADRRGHGRGRVTPLHRRGDPPRRRVAGTDARDPWRRVRPGDRIAVRTVHPGARARHPRALPDDELAAVLGQRRRRADATAARARDRLGGPARSARRRRSRSVARRGSSKASSASLGRLGERRPVLLVIEDLHRADAATRTLVAFLARIARIAAPRDRRHVPGATRIRRERPVVGRPARRSIGAPRPPSACRSARSGATSSPGSSSRSRASGPRRASWSSSSSGPSGRPLIAEELLAARRELPTVSLTSSFQDLVLARVGVRSRRAAASCACWPRPAGRCPAPSSRRSRTRSRRAPRPRPPRSSSGPRRSDGVLDADLTAGLDEAAGARVRHRDGRRA